MTLLTQRETFSTRVVPWADRARIEPLLARHGHTLRHVEHLATISQAGGHEPRLVVTDQDGTAVAAALLEDVRHRTWRPGPHTVRLAGHGHADRLDLPADSSAAAEALAEGILAHAQKWPQWRLQFEQLPRDCRVAQALSSRWPWVADQDGDAIPVLTWPSERDGGPWATKKTRNKYRGAIRKLEAVTDDWNVERLHNAADIEASLPATLALRSRREAHQQRPDAFSRPEMTRAYVDRVGAAAAAGQCETWLLFAEGQLIAYAVAVLQGRTAHLVDSRIHPGHASCSPGMILFGSMLTAWYAEDGLDHVDFGRGINSFKKAFRNHEEPRARLEAWSSSRLRSRDALLESLDHVVRGALRAAKARQGRAGRLIFAVRRVQLHVVARRHGERAGGSDEF